MTKIKTSISIDGVMLNKLKEQAKSRGLDVSAYIAHMVLMEEEREKNKAIIKELMDATENMMKNPGLLALIGKKVE